MLTFILSFIVTVIISFCFFKSKFWENRYLVLLIGTGVALIATLVLNYSVRGHLSTKTEITFVRPMKVFYIKDTLPENKIPFLGICLGMQCAVVEFARNVCGIKNANHTEMVPDTKEPIIDILPEQKNITQKGGTMRLGAYPCRVAEETKARDAYGREEIMQRHRHRYEFNNKYAAQLQSRGLVLSGRCGGRDLAAHRDRPGRPRPCLRTLRLGARLPGAGLRDAAASPGD